MNNTWRFVNTRGAYPAPLDPPGAAAWAAGRVGIDGEGTSPSWWFGTSTICRQGSSAAAAGRLRPQIPPPSASLALSAGARAARVPPVGSRGAEAPCSPYMFPRFDHSRVNGSKGLGPLQNLMVMRF